MVFGRTTKYGIFVPSADVASNWSTVIFDASKRSGIAFTFSPLPVAAFASHGLFGCTYFESEKKLSSVRVFEEPIPIVEFAGRSSLRRVHWLPERSYT